MWDACDDLTRVPLSVYSSVLSYTEDSPWGEFGQPGRIVSDHYGRSFQFVRIDLGGFTPAGGQPTWYTSTARVVLDASDLSPVPTDNRVLAFAGKLVGQVATAVAIPQSGSTLFGWIQCKGWVNPKPRTLIFGDNSLGFTDGPTVGVGKVAKCTGSIWATYTNQTNSVSIVEPTLIYVGVPHAADLFNVIHRPVEDNYIKSFWV